MQVVCPKCKSRFNLPSGTKPGARLRCSVCMTVFSLPSEENSDYDRQSALSSGTLPPLGASDVPQSALPQLEEKKSHHPFLWFLVIVLALGIAGYAAWKTSTDFRSAVIGLKNKIVSEETPAKSGQQVEKSSLQSESSLAVSSQPMENATTPVPVQGAKYQECASVQPADVKKDNEVTLSQSVGNGLYRLEKVRQYFVDNYKIGRILVIEGQVTALQPFLASAVRVEAMIIGEDKKPMEKMQQKVGGKLSLFQLQTMGKEELENALHLEQDTDAKKQCFPFIFLFYNPKKTVNEFAVEILNDR